MLVVGSEDHCHDHYHQYHYHHSFHDDHHHRMLLVVGPEAEEKLRKVFGEGEGSLKEELR